MLQLPLALLSFFYPPAAPLVTLLLKYGPALAAAIPAIQAAVANGESAFEAAKAASPDFAHLVNGLIPHVQGDPTAAHPENIARLLGGFPRMTPSEEQAWMDRFTPSDDSRSGSG